VKRKCPGSGQLQRLHSGMSKTAKKMSKPAKTCPKPQKHDPLRAGCSSDVFLPHHCMLRLFLPSQTQRTQQCRTVLPACQHLATKDFLREKEFSLQVRVLDLGVGNRDVQLSASFALHTSLWHPPRSLTGHTAERTRSSRALS
jgi:hypothetical protein